MELRNIRSFLYAAGEESITLAAAKLHLSQPTVTKHIQALESELGRKLFIRQHFQVRLTDEGILLRDRAEDLIRLVDQIENEFSCSVALEESMLSVGIPELCANPLILRELIRFRHRYPHLKLLIQQEPPLRLREKLCRGLLDLIIVPEIPEGADMGWLALPRADRWGILYPRQKRLPHKLLCTPDDLRKLSLIISENWVQDLVIGWLGNSSPSPQSIAIIHSALLAIRSVREGLGCFLVPEHLIDVSVDNGLAFCPLRPLLETNWYLAWRKQTPRRVLAERFLRQIRRNL
ncbi:MAG: LysR family transcriptional regulator [Firmicutes bacterium]|nr:LysR family transcriptional regulator [Bacillota bacterium]